MSLAEATATVHFDAAFVSAVARVSAMAQAKLPEALHGRIQRATAIVLHGGVWLEEDGHTCQVRRSDGTWAMVNGYCSCEDYQRAPENLCKHRISRMLYLRAGELMREPVILDLDKPTKIGPEPAAAPKECRVRAEYIVTIQGKPFVKFAGLLELAHEEGLVELTATWTFNDASLSLAEAVAVFKDGRHFREAGDATPGNVTNKVAPHFRRVALTRAKARVLRDALGIDMVALEEMDAE